MDKSSGFMSYPSRTPKIGRTVCAALAQLRAENRTIGLETWEENDVAGRFAYESMLEERDNGQLLMGDVARLNYERRHLGLPCPRDYPRVEKSEPGLRGGPHGCQHEGAVQVHLGAQEPHGDAELYRIDGSGIPAGSASPDRERGLTGGLCSVSD